MRQRLIAISWRASLLLPLVLSPWLTRLDTASRQLLFQWRGPIPLADDVVLLGIDEASLNPQLTEFGPWPWPRATQAELARQVLRLGAARVVFNIVHAGPSRLGPDDDLAFQALLKPWQDKVVLSASLVRQQAQEFEQVELRRPWDDAYPSGLSAFSMDEFGVVQSVPGTQQLQALLAPFPTPHPGSLAHLGAGVTSSKREEGIDFLGPSESIQVVPAWAVNTLPEDTWRNKIGIIGSTAPSLGDQLETPFGQQSGSEVLLSAISGLRSGRGFRRLDSIPLALIVIAGCCSAIGGFSAFDRRRLIARRNPSGLSRDGLHHCGLGIWTVVARCGLDPDASGGWCNPLWRPVPKRKFAASVSSLCAVKKGFSKPFARHVALRPGELDALGWSTRAMCGALHRSGGIHGPQQCDGCRGAVSFVESLL